MPRQRLNLSLSPDLYTQLQAIAHNYGFASICEMATTLLTVFARHTRQAEAARRQQQRRTEADAGTYIATMFDEMAQSMPTPDGTVPITHPRRQCK